MVWDVLTVNPSDSKDLLSISAILFLSSTIRIVCIVRKNPN